MIYLRCFETFPRGNLSNMYQSVDDNRIKTELYEIKTRGTFPNMKELVIKAQRGDKTAFIRLIEANKTDLYKIALGILKNDSDAADAIQDTILSCYENLMALRNPKRFKAWMTKILINQCRKIYNERKKTISLQEYREISDPDAFSGHDGFTENQDFLWILDQLEEKYRVVLLLYYLEEFSIKEISAILEVNENTVKTRLARGRGMYKKIYMKEFHKSEGGADDESGE